MQIDMHYYAAYALARAAGMAPEPALIIATASQYVDDSTRHRTHDHDAGTQFRAEATSHHPWQLLPNNDREDQIDVWVPFHFLPGGEGETLTQRLVCRKDSDIAKALVAHTVDQAEQPFALELLGITTHVYADTFAHFGFSGVSSRRNRVDGSSLHTETGTPTVKKYLGDRVSRFFEKYDVQGGLLANFRTLVSGSAEILTSGGIEDGALGHGAVAICPDQPYLEWSYS